jgi:hypothetical protein
VWRGYIILSLQGIEIQFPRKSGHYNETVTAASNDIYQCESNRIDNDYYFGDDDDGYCSNDNDVDNDNSLTEATHLI